MRVRGTLHGTHYTSRALYINRRHAVSEVRARCDRHDDGRTMFFFQTKNRSHEASVAIRRATRDRGGHGIAWTIFLPKGFGVVIAVRFINRRESRFV